MKIEEVIKQLESIADHTERMLGDPDADEIWEKDIEALKFAITALCSMPEAGEPLSLEQLKQMDGKPVWVVCLKKVKYIDPPIGWRILEKSISGSFGVWNGENCLSQRSYGSDWLAYSYPPAQQRWIPVSERLPDRRRRVLCRLSYPDIEDIIVENQYYGNGMWMEESEAVTHWMPLPEPPEEG